MIFLTDEVRSGMVAVLVLIFFKEMSVVLGRLYTNTAVLSAYLKPKDRQNFISNKFKLGSAGREPQQREKIRHIWQIQNTCCKEQAKEWYA